MLHIMFSGSVMALPVIYDSQVWDPAIIWTRKHWDKISSFLFNTQKSHIRMEQHKRHIYFSYLILGAVPSHTQVPSGYFWGYDIIIQSFLSIRKTIVKIIASHPFCRLLSTFEFHRKNVMIDKTTKSYYSCHSFTLQRGFVS